MYAHEMNELFDAVEELTGTEPSGINLRSGIHAIITKSMDLDKTKSLVYRAVGSTTIMNNVEYLARKYEACRVTSQTIGGGN